MREFEDRVQDNTTATGTGPFIPANSVIAGYRTFGAAHALGASFDYFAINGSEWESGLGTLTSGGITRAPSRSSNGNALVNFSTAPTVFETVGGDQFAHFLSATTISFSSVVLLTRPGQANMPQQAVASVLAFTPAANPVAGAFAFVSLLADGTNAPTFTGFTEHGGSMGYDNRAGILNLVQFFYLAGVCWYSVTQAANAVPVDLVAPTASSAAVANASPTVITVTASEALDPSFVPAASTITVGGHVANSIAVAGATFSITCATAFAYGEAARTVAYVKPGSNGLRDSAGNLMESFSGLAITNNVAAPATVPATMVAPVATAGVTSASVSYVNPANGGSAILDVTLTASTGQTMTVTSSPAVFTGLAAGTAVTFTAKARNAVGVAATASPASNSVTPTASATVPATMAAPVITAGDGSISIAWVAPADGGSAILDATFTASTGQTATGATSPTTMTVPNGTAVTVTGKARNAVGSAATASPASNSVTPTAATFTRLGSLLRITESGSGPYTYTGTGSGFGSGTEGSGRLAVSLAAGVDGSFALRQPNIPVTQANGMMIGLDGATGGTTYGVIDYGMAFYGSKYTPFFNSVEQTINGATVGPAANDWMRVRRTGSTIYLEVSKDGGSTYSVVHSVVGSTGILYGYIISSQSGVADSLTTVGFA